MTIMTDHQPDVVEVPDDEPATYSQARFLAHLHIALPAHLTKREATATIKQALADGLQPDPGFHGDGPPTPRQVRWLARNGLQAPTAWEASALIGSLPVPPTIRAQVLAMAAAEPFRYGIGDLARVLGRGKRVGPVVQRLVAEGAVVVRREPGGSGRKLVGTSTISEVPRGTITESPRRP